MEKLPILVDMDGVFADFMGSYYKIAKQNHPELYNALPDINKQKYFYVDDEIKESHPHLQKLAESIVNHEDVFKNIEPYDGMIEGMNLLRETAKKDNREVFICTAPHRSNKLSYSQKPEWVEKHLGFDWLNNLLVVRDKTVCTGAILIDDKPEPLGTLTPIWEHIVFDRSYNRTGINEHQKRIFNLDVSTIDYLLHRCNIIDHE